MSNRPESRQAPQEEAVSENRPQGPHECGGCFRLETTVVSVSLSNGTKLALCLPCRRRHRAIVGKRCTWCKHSQARHAEGRGECKAPGCDCLAWSAELT